jgi:hypothetical protein
MTDDQAPCDPHGLLTSGEELATENELAKLLSVPRVVLHKLLHGALYEHVRFVRAPPGAGKWRYSVADARAAIEPHRVAIEERRRKADAREAADRAAAAAREAAKAPPSREPAPVASKLAPAPPRAPARPSPRRGGRASAAGGLSRREAEIPRVGRCP